MLIHDFIFSMFWKRCFEECFFLFNASEWWPYYSLFTGNHSLYGFEATWGWLFLIYFWGQLSLSCSFCNNLTALKVISVLFFHMRVPLHGFSLRNMSHWKKSDRNRKFLEGNVPPGLLTLFKEFDTCVVHTFDGSSPLRLSLWPSGRIRLKTQAFSLYSQTKLCLFSFLQSSGAFSVKSLASEAVSAAPYAAGRNKRCFSLLGWGMTCSGFQRKRISISALCYIKTRKSFCVALLMPVTFVFLLELCAQWTWPLTGSADLLDFACSEEN